MGTGSSAFNRNDISIDFPEDILREFFSIKQKYFVKEDGSYKVDIISLNCKAIIMIIQLKNEIEFIM